MKRFASITLAILLAASFSITAFAESYVPSREFMYNWALEAGFPVEFLDAASDHMIEKIYFDNVGAEELEIYYSGSYLTESLPESDTMQPRGAIPEEDMFLQIIAGVVARDGFIQYINVYIDYDWLIGPMIKLYDGIAVNWDESLFGLAEDTFWTTFSGELNPEFYTTTRIVDGGQGGIGWEARLTGAIGLPSGEAFLRLDCHHTNMHMDGPRFTPVSVKYAHRTYEAQVIEFSYTYPVAAGAAVQFVGTYDTAYDFSNVEYEFQ